MLQEDAVNKERLLMLKTMREVRRSRRNKARFFYHLEHFLFEPISFMMSVRDQAFDYVCVCGRGFDICVENDFGLALLCGEVMSDDKMKETKARAREMKRQRRLAKIKKRAMGTVNSKGTVATED